MDLISILGALAGSGLLGGGATAAGKSGKFRQLPTMSPEQIGRANIAGQLGLEQIQNPYAGFDPIANRARSQFQQQTVPGLAERFTSMGKNALSSTAFTSQLGQAGAGLEEALASLMAQYGQNQQSLGQSLLGMGQKPQFENAYVPGGHTFLSSLFGGVAPGLASMGMGGFQQNNLKKLIAQLGQG